MEQNGAGVDGTGQDSEGRGSLRLSPGPAIRLAGTFYHQDSLHALAPRIPAGRSSAVTRVPVRLRHDPGSAHGGAVAVDHGGRLLGYLPRAWAPLFHDVLTTCEAADRTVTATAVLRCSAEDAYVSVEVEAAPPGADPAGKGGGPDSAQPGSSARAPRRRARSRAGWPFGTVLACVVVTTAAAAVVGPAAAAELVTLVGSETTTGGGGGGSAQSTAL